MANPTNVSWLCFTVMNVCVLPNHSRGSICTYLPICSYLPICTHLPARRVSLHISGFFTPFPVLESLYVDPLARVYSVDLYETRKSLLREKDVTSAHPATPYRKVCCTYVQLNTHTHTHTGALWGLLHPCLPLSMRCMSGACVSYEDTCVGVCS